jgi:hypothetical protein
MNELAIIGEISEPIYHRLGDLQPFGYADFLADFLPDRFRRIRSHVEPAAGCTAGSVLDHPRTTEMGPPAQEAPAG